MSLPQIQLAALAAVFAGAPLSAQCETQPLLGSDTDAGDRLGAFAALDGDVAVATAVDEGVLGPESGAAYVFERLGDQWIEVAKLTASDGAFHDRFGSSADVDGERIAIGAVRANGATLDSGAVYVFERFSGSWTEVAKVVASNGTTGAGFGGSLDLEGDRLVVGAMDAEVPPWDGGVYVYSGAGGSWVEEGVLGGPAATPVLHFGGAVSVSGDKLLVGASLSSPFGTATGAAFAFERSAGTWSLAASLIPPDLAADDWFGESVALVGGNALVGAPGSNQVAFDVGLVYVFDASTWLATGKLKPDDTKEGLRFGQFLSHDHAARMVVATGLTSATSLGGAYLFEKHAGQWVHSGKVEVTTPPVTFAARWPALDGSTLLLGDSKDSTLGADAGAVGVYRVTGVLEPFGQGNPALLGFQPGLYGSGCAAPGGTLTVRTNYGFPGFGGALLGATGSAAFPFGVGQIVVAPPFFLQVPHVLSGPPGGVGKGQASFVFPLPVNPALAGLQVYLQAGYLDSFALGGVSLTNGIHVVFGSAP